jgi:hypothetical protein
MQMASLLVRAIRLRIAHAVVPAVLLSVVLAWPIAAQAAGDAARGNSLYHTTWHCTDCHTSDPSQRGARNLNLGATVQGLLDAIANIPEMTPRYASTLANNSIDLADIAAYLALVTVPPNTGVDLDQHGLTGSWFEPATSGQGFQIEVYPDMSAPGSGLVFVSWFTYDTVVGGAERQRWYTGIGPVVSGQPNAALTVYRNTGGNFNALPVTNAIPVGTATLSFDSCTSGQLAYSFTDGSGLTGTIPLTRLTQNVTCSTTSARPTNADFAHSGNWYDPATSGQGFAVEFSPTSGVLFFGWFTYAPNGANSGVAGQRWYSGLGNIAPGARTATIPLLETTGGAFDAPSVPAPNTVTVGSGTWTFLSCSAATFDYHFTGGSSSGMSGTIALSRVGPTPSGCAQ